MPKFENIKPALKKRKRKNRPKLPSEIKEIKLTGEYRLTNKQSSFLIYNGKNNKILVFCSDVGLEILSKSERWGGDGTFHVASNYFYQLYIIHGYFMNRMIPCVYALMNRRRETHYDKVLKVSKIK